MLRHLFWPLFILASLVSANVEKLVFLGPPASPAAIRHPSISRLTPPQTTLRTQFHSRFEDTAPHPQGIPSESWSLLTGLTPKKRYEVRICWPAVQPTAFDMKLYTPEEVMQDQELIESVRAGKQIPPAALEHKKGSLSDHEQSRLFLHIKATADYFTMNQTLMENGLIVDVDIILDEYILNLAPSSLLNTGLYLIGMAVVAAFVSRLVLRFLDDIVAQDTKASMATDKKTS